MQCDDLDASADSDWGPDSAADDAAKFKDDRMEGNDERRNEDGRE